jgi:hypothetical protein
LADQNAVAYDERDLDQRLKFKAVRIRRRLEIERLRWYKLIWVAGRKTPLD